MVKTFEFSSFLNKMYCLCIHTLSTFYSLTYIKPYIFRHILTGVLDKHLVKYHKHIDLVSLSEFVYIFYTNQNADVESIMFIILSTSII